jgi:glycerophosphoryl diester phosphodiesterase
MNPSIVLIHHAANRGLIHPPNSIRGLKTCLNAGARIIEVDIAPLAGGDFVLLHDRLLEHATDGSGLVSEHTSNQVAGLRLAWRGSLIQEPVAFLSQALELVASHPQPVELQLDLKPYIYLNEGILAGLAQALQAVKERVRVTSEADWALRRLHALDAELPLGFDPMLYLDVIPHQTEGQHFTPPPFRRGAYGYWDDHPLASLVWGSKADYLAARAEALWPQVPSATVWYIRASLLARVLEDGFDWIADLHRRQAKVAAWTLNAAHPPDVELAWQLAAAGVDRVTTDDAPALAQALAGRAEGRVGVEY